MSQIIPPAARRCDAGIVPRRQRAARPGAGETAIERIRLSAAAEKLRETGPNRTESAGRKRLLGALAERLANPLVLILLFAAGVSLFTGDYASVTIVSAIVLISVVQDVAQEHQAQNAADELRARVSLSATVLRDGQPKELVRRIAGDAGARDLPDPHRRSAARPAASGAGRPHARRRVRRGDHAQAARAMAGIHALAV
jgi:hypothetical protein